MIQLQQQFLNKKVKVENISTPFEKSTSVVGKCNFIGFNHLLKKHQVTIDRMPIFLNNYNQVKLY